MPESCTNCGGALKPRFMPMEEWGIKGPLCGVCYSKKLHEHYPGEHVRMGQD